MIHIHVCLNAVSFSKKKLCKIAFSIENINDLHYAEGLKVKAKERNSFIVVASSVPLI